MRQDQKDQLDLEFYRSIEDDLWRIVEAVQKNGRFFEEALSRKNWGLSSIQVAADYLEIAVKSDKTE